LGIPQIIEECFDLILEKILQIENSFEQAFFVLVQLPYLQPFDYGNKYVSRLAANLPFNQHNLELLSFIDVPEEIYVKGMLGIYELNRIELFKDVFYGLMKDLHYAIQPSVNHWANLIHSE
jgi:hypothetical protein